MIPASIALSTVCLLLPKRAQRMFWRRADMLHVRRDRHVARRIGEVRRHLVGGDVPEQLFGARARPALAVADIDQRRIGEPVDRDVLAAPGLAPAPPIAFEYASVASKPVRNVAWI